jgi:Fe-S-cluster containining protein
MEIASTGSTENSEKTKYRSLLIDELKKEIERAHKFDLEKLAAEIKKMGFCCKHCGNCCRQAFGNNRVLLTPEEIEKIQDYTGISKLEFVEPFLPEIALQEDDWESSRETKPENSFAMPVEIEKKGSKPPVSIDLLHEDIDCEGNIHTFGWALRRNINGDCGFLEKNTYRCRIYPVRPMLCKTYPFYLESLKLQTCECEGLGNSISSEDSMRIAENLLLRYVSELKDTLGMYEKFIDFEKGEKGIGLAKQNLERGMWIFIVHDSTGSTKFIRRQD